MNKAAVLEVWTVASRKGYRIESVPITTVYSDQVSKIRPVRGRFVFPIDVALPSRRHLT